MIEKDFFMNGVTGITEEYQGRKKIMKNIKRFVISFVIGCFLLLPAFPGGIVKAAGMVPTASDNLAFELISSSELVTLDSGYMRVFYDGEKIGIEYYDNDFNIQSKKSLNMELSYWGGFYAGSDAYYLVEGQANVDESDTAEVIRVLKYDTNWNKIGTAKLFGDVIRYPFDHGCVEMTEYDGTLYIVTGHQGYVDPAYNQGHQGFLMIAVDETAMTGEIVDWDLWHSFAQYIACKDSDLYILEQSEGSRCTQLSKYDAATLKNTPISVLEYGGSRTSAWAIPCYASVDGIAISSDNVLCLGTSIDQSQYESVSLDTAHNIYLTVTPMANFSEDATTVKWLTDYSGGGKCFLGTKIIKINDNRFMVSWEEAGTSQAADTDDTLSTSILHYVFLDGSGNVISKEFTAAAPISDCQPVVKGSKIVYYASSVNMVNFYSIDAQTGEFSKKVYRVAGENATWNFDNGVLTISGTGAMSIDENVHYRYPLSSTTVSFSFSDDSVWKSIKENVKKIVIDEGITDIPERAFAYLGNLEEVEIKPGLETIGKEAFYCCESLSKITIPASVTNIGEDFLWTAYYWISDGSHVVYATIYAPQNSYAAEYAKQNGIRVSTDSDTGQNTESGQDTDTGKDTDIGKDKGKDTDTGDTISILKATVSGIRKSYVYSGKKQTPKVTVQLDDITLKKDTDYTVSYSDNIHTGKATIEIKGINNYNGTIIKAFKIVPKKAMILKLKSPKSKTIKVSWKKDSQADGYQIQYAENSKFTKGKKSVTVTKRLTGSKTVSKLTKGRKYYVRVRAYKKIDGKKCYGSWSKTRKVKSK